jgi:hypothetical protein
MLKRVANRARISRSISPAEIPMPTGVLPHKLLSLLIRKARTKSCLYSGDSKDNDKLNLLTG